MGKQIGKAVAVHTHPNETSWVTKRAAQRLFENGVTVRNQTVLLRGVNDNVSVMKKLINGLADMNIQPVKVFIFVIRSYVLAGYFTNQYYVYQGDEDLRTPLSTILELEMQIRGTIGGFLTP